MIVQAKSNEEQPTTSVQAKSNEEQPTTIIQAKSNEEQPTTSVQAKSNEEQPTMIVQAKANEEQPTTSYKAKTNEEQPTTSVEGKANKEHPTRSVEANAAKQLEGFKQIISGELGSQPPRKRLNIQSDSTSSPLIILTQHSTRNRKSKRNRLRHARLLKSNEFRNNSHSHVIPTQDTATASTTLEEGEILSDDHQANEESKNLNNKNQEDVANSNNNDDDDCICIEQAVELITIVDETDDPTPVNIGDTKANNTKLLTSTPQEKMKTSTSESKFNTKNVNNCNEKFAAAAPADGTPIFHKDRSYQKWLDSVVSNDTFFNYTQDDRTFDGRNQNGPRRSERLQNKTETNWLKSDDSDVIVLDESTLKPMASRTTDRSSLEMDDSVIFVSESAAPGTKECPAFIPLEADNVPNPISLVNHRMTPKSKHPRNSFFTKSEKKQLTEYNDNAYNPGASKKLVAGKRMVIIDGSNVAFNHALNMEFSVEGLKICLEYFEKMGHEVKAVVPQFRLNRYKSSDPDALATLHRAGKIVFTPCKNLPTTRSISYDDRFILQLACELDAAIVSNDNYRDLINENSAFKKIIENRVIGYTWCNNIFILPKDPYGKWGPPLHSILNRS